VTTRTSHRAERLTLENLAYPKVPGAAEPLHLEGIKDLQSRGAGVPSSRPPGAKKAKTVR